ncbi:serine hydrolase [Chryseobacterium oryctis]|uniref:Serine hydrolase n=1 Tax=Chryseobacterium oryctis TaxID=2952618 RepID=A0ABT3HK52_9FLAO|nr:serine hydrolase [Chryseobacterium oryctis]MCW3160167.1 serine hydrolase [Chryseobacterium oryctis]
MDLNVQNLLRNSGATSASIGVVKNGKLYIKHYGEIDKGKGNKPNNETYYEIASVTKIITGTLLANAVLEGKVKLNDDIRVYLKDSYPNLQYNEIPIRIKDLISFESALPRSLPDETSIWNVKRDENVFLSAKINKEYSRQSFLSDLKRVKLDTIPGTKYNYSNLSLELTGYMLENIYHKDFQQLTKENFLYPLAMNHTKFDLDKNEVLANGYNEKNVLMPHFENNLWGATGKLKSTMDDLTKLLQYELSDSKLVTESQRNVNQSNTHWFGYFWDRWEITDKGKFGYKHGGAYGTQTLFTVFPEINLGICIVVNIGAENTFYNLQSTVLNLAEDLTNQNTQNIYGYRFKGNNVVFSYIHDKKLDSKLISSISVAGNFNDWNPDNPKYQLVRKSKNKFEITLPKTDFEKGKTYLFKFVINKESWLSPPKNSINTDKAEDNHLTFKID